MSPSKMRTTNTYSDVGIPSDAKCLQQNELVRPLLIGNARIAIKILTLLWALQFLMAFVMVAESMYDGWALKASRVLVLEYQV